MTMDQLTEFFKWMSIINIGLLLFSTFAVMALRSMMINMNTSLFGVTEEQVKAIAYGYLGMFKVLIIVFNIAPWLALHLMN